MRGEVRDGPRRVRDKCPLLALIRYAQTRDTATLDFCSCRRANRDRELLFSV